MVTKVKVECCFSEKCIDAGKGKCTSCTHNEKRSYYRPTDSGYWIYPYIPSTPTQPWYPYVPSTATTAIFDVQSSGNISYDASERYTLTSYYSSS